MKKRVRITRNNMEEILKQRLALIAGLFVLALYVIQPLAITPNTYYTITKLKLDVFSAIIVIGGASLLLMFGYFLTKDYLPQWDIRNRVRRIELYEWFLLAYWLWLFISACASPYPQAAWTGSSERPEGFWIKSAYLITFWIISRLYKPKLRDLMIFCIVAAVVALYGILQYYEMDFLGFNVPGYGEKNVELTFISTMSNRNVLSTYLCLGVCISAALFCQHEGRLRWVFLPCALISFYMLLLGDTESGYVGMLVAFVLCFALIAKNRKSAAHLFLLLGLLVFLLWLDRLSMATVVLHNGTLEEMLQSKLLLAAGASLVISLLLFVIRWPVKIPPRVWRIAWACLLAVVIIAGIVSLPMLAEQTGSNTLKEASGLLRGEWSDDMGSYRGYIWRRCIDVWLERPVAGVGPDAMLPAFLERYQDEMVARYNVVFDKAHNEYLQALVDTGIIGFICILGFYALLMWRARKWLDSPMVLALFFAMLCFLVQAFFNISQALSTPIVWAMWGTLGALVYQAKQSGQNQS